MRYIVFALLSLFLFKQAILVASETPDLTAQETADPEQPFSADEGEEKEPALTPVSVYPQRKPYERARDTLQKAIDLWKKGDAELASETALEAYDDLVDVRIPRKQKQARRKLLAERQRAATVYIESSLAYIKKYVKQNGNTEAAKAEGRERLGDLRNVSRDYPELNGKVSRALQS